MNIGRKKGGRAVDESQRDRARMLVAMYKQAEKSPGGRYCVNPEAPMEERAYLEYTDPRLLIGALETFAKHGTFTDPFDDAMTDWAVQFEFQKLRESGVAYQESLAVLGEKFGVSDSTIRRRVSTSKRDTK